jgi:hypothetical protein
MFNCWDWPLFRVVVFDNSGKLEDLRERDVDFLKQNRYVNQYGTEQNSPTASSNGSGDHRVDSQSDGGSDPVVQGRSRASAEAGLVEAGNTILERYRAEGKLTDDEVRAFKGELSPTPDGTPDGPSPSKVSEPSIGDGDILRTPPDSGKEPLDSSQSEQGADASLNSERAPGSGIDLDNEFSVKAGEHLDLIETARGEGDIAQQENKRKGGMAGAISLDGKTHVARSANIGGGKIHQRVKDFLDAIPQSKRAPNHGNCAEVRAISALLDAGIDPAGGVFVAVKVGGKKRGEVTGPCLSCIPLLKHFKVKYVVPD